MPISPPAASPGHASLPVVFLLFLCLLAPFWLPGEARGAGFFGPGTQATVTTAAAALAASDDTPCLLRGRIEARLPGRKYRYIFADASGRIVVVIKRKIFGPRTVTPQNLVQLEGEVDWSPKHPNEVEVDALEIIE